jgi:hypothetical protein
LLRIFDKLSFGNLPSIPVFRFTDLNLPSRFVSFQRISSAERHTGGGHNIVMEEGKKVAGEGTDEFPQAIPAFSGNGSCAAEMRNGSGR